MEFTVYHIMLTNPDLKYFAKQSQIAIGYW